MTTYYVATNGSNAATGSATLPWRSISHAMQSSLRPGDEVVVRAGTYNESVTMGKDGTASSYITLRSEVPGGAVIRPPAGSNGITINADYVAVEGFEVYGSGSHGIVGVNVHHVKVSNNVSHDNAASGISFAWSDFVTVEGNVTYKNASSGWFSGISLYQNRNITNTPDDGSFRNIIRNNISHDNVTKSGAHTDGNGIIIDDFQSTQTSGFPNYTHRTLVENNLVYENGSKGIHVTWSDSVTVRNNTAWHNNQDLQNTGTWRGELSNAQSSNNVWLNNIAVADPSIQANNTAIDNTSYAGYKNQNVVWYNNITFNGTAGQASVRTDGGNAMPTATNGNKLGVDPRFVQAPSDFHVQAGSPAIDSGTNRFGLASVDLDGDSRTVGTVDIGAYEGGSGGGAGTGGGSGNDAPQNIALGGSNTVAETATGGTVIGQLSAVDPDGDTIAFSVSGDSRFAVNGSGQLVVAQGANLAVTGNQTVPLTFTASDGKGGVTSTGIGVTILDTPSSPSGVTLYGDSGDNQLYGGTGNDSLFGYGGRDYLSGGNGNDQLRGGTGKDTLVGGANADAFVFASTSESPRGWDSRDVIQDFSRSQGDKIDLSGIDANTSWSGDQTFSFIGSNGFSGSAGQLRYNNGVVSGDVNGDGTSDFQIQLTNAPWLSGNDFLL